MSAALDTLQSYVAETLRNEGVEDEDRIERILASIAAGQPWHPRNAGELRASLAILSDALERRPVAVEALQLLGPMLREDCLP